MSDYKYIQINPEIATLEDIHKEIQRLEFLQVIHTNEEQGIKLSMNSMYGAIGSPYFIAYNPAVAEALTLQGQDMIKYILKMCDHYFKELWHKDTELHKSLGVNVLFPVTKPVAIYTDTDSCYLCFQELLNNCDWSGSETEFIINIYEKRLKKYFDKCLEKYAQKYRTKNIQNLELENISRAGIWLEKKKYVLDLCWKDPGVEYDICEEMISKGVEMVRSSTPPFARNKMIELVKYMLRSKKSFDIGEYVSYLNTTKREFNKASIDDISLSTKIGDYEKYVINDTTKVELRKGCTIHVRASAYYNFIIKKNNATNKYPLIKTNDRVKYYHTKGSFYRVFAYHPGEFPSDLFVPEIDKDLQFDKTMIHPLNRFVKAMGHQEVPSSLVIGRALF